jgi:hypothetical protein
MSKNTSRITRSQQQGRALPPVANQQRKSALKLSTVVQERVIAHPEHQRPDDQRFVDMSKQIEVLSAANQKLENTLQIILDEFRLVQQNVQLIQTENSELKAVNEELRKNVAAVFDDMDYLMGKVERIDQKVLSKDVEISGVPGLMKI